MTRGLRNGFARRIRRPRRPSCGPTEGFGRTVGESRGFKDFGIQLLRKPYSSSVSAIARYYVPRAVPEESAVREPHDTLRDGEISGANRTVRFRRFIQPSC